MTRPDTTKRLSELLEKHIDPFHDKRIYWAKEVTFDYATDHSIRVDYMRFKPANNTVSGIEKGDFFCYEIKSSVEDFRSPNGHNFIGDYNYYVMPEEVYEVAKPTLPWKIGVLVPEEEYFGGRTHVSLKSVKKAQRTSRTRPVSEMLLMMFRSSNRELRKFQKAERERQNETGGEADG